VFVNAATGERRVRKCSYTKAGKRKYSYVKF
jgi:hypothetical protein